jgi:hypothetical protein
LHGRVGLGGGGETVGPILEAAGEAEADG